MCLISASSTEQSVDVYITRLKERTKRIKYLLSGTTEVCRLLYPLSDTTQSFGVLASQFLGPSSDMVGNMITSRELGEFESLRQRLDNLREVIFSSSTAEVQSLHT